MLMFRAVEYLPLVCLAVCWVALLWRHAAAEMLKRRAQFATDEMYRRITGHKPTRRPVFKWLAVIRTISSNRSAAAQGGYHEEAIMGEGLDLVVARYFEVNVFRRY